MSKLIEVRIGDYRAVELLRITGVDCKKDDYVIVEFDRGSEFGRVVSDARNFCKDQKEKVSGKVLRVATEGDIKQIENNRLKSKDAVNTCLRKASERKLDMRIVKAECSFDNSKIIFYFTADGRVDFRSLVKDLAKMFRVRIELRQIGVRDKAKIVSGYGVCGRELCCSSYMKDFHALSIKMAKQQGLPLNPSKISGVCGRIKCCMAYEFEVYKEFSRKMPKLGQKIDTPDGRGKVIGLNILKRFANVDLGEGKITKVSYGAPSTN